MLCFTQTLEHAYAYAQLQPGWPYAQCMYRIRAQKHSACSAAGAGGSDPKCKSFCRSRAEFEEVDDFGQRCPIVSDANAYTTLTLKKDVRTTNYNFPIEEFPDSCPKSRADVYEKLNDRNAVKSAFMRKSRPLLCNPTETNPERVSVYAAQARLATAPIHNFAQQTNAGLATFSYDLSGVLVAVIGQLGLPVDALSGA
jgi:hypothetical protein